MSPVFCVRRPTCARSAPVHVLIPGAILLFRSAAFSQDAALPPQPVGKARAPEEKTPELDDAAAEPVEPAPEIVVHGSRAPTSASESIVFGRALRDRPRRRPGEVVEAAPGVISVQHAGGGKANQYFLRGFDIDHGTDLRFEVDGMPVNMPSHGHGQGYTDLHFVIPEVLSSIEVHKGPYYAEFGNFATAGTLEMHVADQLPESLASVSVGQFGYARGVAAVSEPVSSEARVLAAGEVAAEDGPYENAQGLRRLNLLGRVTQDLGRTGSATLSWMSYSSRWNASGQIPLREVEAGRLDRFGAIDPTEGGATQRHSLSLRLAGGEDDARFEAHVYGIRYDFRLFSNFTFFLEDPVLGDQIEQTDDRGVLGADVRTRLRHDVGLVKLETTAGVQARSDRIDNGLHHTARRERVGTTVDARTTETATALFVDEQARFFRWLAVRAGLRVDRFDVSVEDRLEDPATLGNGRGGTAGATLLSPKATLILSPKAWLDLFVNFGRGFHSNDARGAVRSVDAADLLAPATGYEVGTRVTPGRPLVFTLALYRLDLDSEQVYVGDAGTTEPSARSTRYGVETTAELTLGRWLHTDAALTLNRAVYRGNAGNAGSVALAPTRTFTGGVAAHAPWGSFASVRVRHVGSRPATEDGSIVADGWTILSARAGHRQGPFEVALDVENVLDATWREVQFATESQLRGESAPVEEIHFAPGWPFTAHVTASVYF